MTLKNTILLAALIAAVATIPLKNQWNSIATIFFVAACAIQHPLSVSYTKLKQSKFWIIPVLYFTWLAFSHFWDYSGGYRLRDIERYLILFFVPPAMAISPDIIKKFIGKACLAFILVTAVVSIICLIKSYVEYQATHDYRVFYYQYLGEQMGLNAVFLSNYCLASITWLLYYTLFGKKQRASVYVVITAAIIFFLIMLLLLASKLVIFLTLIMMMAFILAAGYVKGFFLKAAVVTLIIICAGGFAITKMSYLRWRITSTELKKYAGEADNQNGIAIRLYMWQTVSELISRRPVLGYGIRGGRLETLRRYKEDGFEMGVQGDYHSHNQYLESLLMAGIPAFLMLLAMIAVALRNGFRYKNILLLLMLIHFMAQSVIESTFEVQHELVFYIFFIFLFYYHGPRFRNTLF